MIDQIDTFIPKENKKIFELIDNDKFQELSTFIQDEENEIWNIYTEDKKNLLHYACEIGKETTIKLIITQLKIRLGINSYFNNINDNFSNSINLFKYFINSKTKKEGYTPLHYAILSFSSYINMNSQQNINIIKFLLLNQADPYIKTNSNLNVLHLCAISNNTNALVLFKEKYLFDINAKDAQLKTPLHYSIEKNNYETLNILINYEGIDVNPIDKDGNTPIHYAIFNNHSRSIKKLIQYHAKLNIRNKNRRTALELGLNSINNNIRNIFTKKTFMEQIFFEQTIKKGETNIIKMIVFFLIHLFSIILNYFFLMPCYVDRFSKINILYIILTFITIGFYFVLFYSDPGYLDNQNSHYCNLLEVLDDGKDVINYCPMTFILIEGNSKFCLICQKYIKGFNHHCYWVGNCIGENNFNKFMIFICICIINTGYNLLLIIIYFSPKFVKYILNLNSSLIYNNNESNGNFNLIKGIRGSLALIGIYISIIFLNQLIELFKYHYKSMKERNKNRNKNILI